MASTVYYGKSTTNGNEAVKRVLLNDSSITENSLHEGDMLLVYFSQGLRVDGPRLVLTIGDINNEISVSNDSGKAIYSAGNPAKSGDWTDGETVTFVYSKNSNNNYYWEITTHNIRASGDSYGGVLIDAGDDSASSVGNTKNLIDEGIASLRLDYDSRNRTEIGTLILSSQIPGNPAQIISNIPITMPSFPAIPTALSDFADNERQISIANAYKFGYFENDNFKIILNLKAQQLDGINDVRITSPRTLYLTTDLPETDYNGTLAINKQLDNKTYALVLSKYLMAEAPFFSIDWDGRIKCKDYNGNFKSIFDIFYPVGSYYETSNTSFNPNTAWGGTWELETQGKVHIGSGADYTVGGTGGSKTTNFSSTGTTDSHTLVLDEIPSHKHIALKRKRSSVDDFLGGSEANYGAEDATVTVSKFDDSKNYYTSSSGGGKGHTHNFGLSVNNINVMQPYIVVKRWHRTA